MDTRGWRVVMTGCATNPVFPWTPAGLEFVDAMQGIYPPG